MYKCLCECFWDRDCQLCENFLLAEPLLSGFSSFGVGVCVNNGPGIIDGCFTSKQSFRLISGGSEWVGQATAGIATYAFTLQQLKLLRNKNEMSDDMSNTIALKHICIEHVKDHSFCA
jgi:hypothetical protein